MIKKNIPNLITSLNVVSGSIAVVLALQGMLVPAILFIFAGAVFDFFDGMAARALKAYSPLGKELDSLADMISFGLAPGTLIYVLIQYSIWHKVLPVSELIQQDKWYFVLISLLIPICSALRLAKFNIDERQTSSFIGLPTPANTLFFASLVVCFQYGTNPDINQILFSPYILTLLTVVFSLLLPSEIPMFAFKFKNLKWKENKVRFLFIISIPVFVLLLQSYSLSIIICFYILLSILTQRQNKE